MTRIDEIRARLSEYNDPFTQDDARYLLSELDAALKAVERLQRPAVVLAEAERLLREQSARKVHFWPLPRRLTIDGDVQAVGITGVRNSPPGGQQCGPGDTYGSGPTLADAYAKLLERDEAKL